MQIIWAIMFKLGSPERLLYILMAVMSITAVWLTYLVGKEMYNKKIGLIAAVGMSVLWIDLFYAARLLVDVPAFMFFLAGVLFLWKYLKQKVPKYIYLAGLFFGLMLFTRQTTYVLMLGILLFLLISTRAKFLFDKHMWLGAVIALLVYSPYLYFVIFIKKASLYATYVGERTIAATGEPIGAYAFLKGLYDYAIQFPNYISWPWLIFLMIGIFYTVLALDIIIKNKEHQNDLFTLLWIVPYYLLFAGITGPGVGYLEPRYLLFIFPPIFFLMGRGLLDLKNWIKNKYITAFVIVLILLIGIFINLTYAHNLIMFKAGSQIQVKEAALWMKERTSPEQGIISVSVPQTQYYAERNVYNPHHNNCSKMEEVLSSKNIKFYAVTTFERGIDPCYLTYPQEHPDLFVPVKAYYFDEAKTQPAVIIYEFLG